MIKVFKINATVLTIFPGLSCDIFVPTGAGKVSSLWFRFWTSVSHIRA